MHRFSRQVNNLAACLQLLNAGKPQDLSPITPLTPEVGRGFTATDGGALKLRPTTAPYGFGGQRVSRIRNGGRALISSNNCARYAPSTPMPSRLAEPKNSTTTVSDVHPDTATPVTHE